MIAPRLFSSDDLWNVRYLGNASLSPDGRRVAFVVQRNDRERNEVCSAIYLLQLDEQGQVLGEARQLTSGTKRDSNPAWAPDSRRLLFISDREEKNQLWLIDTDGGEARQLTHMLRGVSEATWSPDGRWIAFTAAAKPADEDDMLTGRKAFNEAAKKKEEEEQRFGKRRESTVWYRFDGRGRFEQFSQLFVMPAPAGEAVGEQQVPRRLSSGEYDCTQPSWTPDSREIGVLRQGSNYRAGSWVTDLWCFQAETGEDRCLTEGSLEINSYSWSPDGHQVVLVASPDSTHGGPQNTYLYLLAREGGQARGVTMDIDNITAPMAFSETRCVPGPYCPQWSEDGKRIYFVVTERCCVNLYRLDVEQQVSVPLLAGEQLIFFLALLPGERGLVLGRDELLHPWELYLLPLDQSSHDTAALKPLTHLHDHWLAEFTWSQPERLEFESANGESIDGWLIRPPGARAGTRYPLLVNIHGGPHSAFGAGMNLRFQRYAAAGFAVFYCNPHGSTGCGEAFMRQVLGDWGGLDYQDIMRGVDKCIELGVADPERMAVTGYSYGGYMSMFIIGQTGRFKAAVPMAGVSNLVSFVGTSDVGYWMVHESLGAPWEEERTVYYRERSPLTHAPRVTTPTLFLHPENDLRCPIEQSEQFYVTLKLLGNVPVEMVRIPAAWHGNSTKPGQFLEYWELMLEWVRQYIEVSPVE